MMNGDDLKIIESAIEGESSAFGLLYDRYQPQIYRFIYLKTSHREEAEDLTHQVFLNAWKNIENYRHKGFPFSSWLYQIARNQVIDHYRTKKTTTSLEVIEEIEEEESTPHKKAEIKFEMEAVKNAIPQLPLEQQDVIIMRFVEELSPKEIALALEKPESTIRVLQHRAIKNLQKLLKQP